jgi:hypothetical protein
MRLDEITEAMPGRFAKSDDTKRAERNAKRRAQRSAEKSKNDKLLDKYWRVFTDMAAQTYPDADPIDACFQKYRDFDMDKLNAAAKKHGYNDPMDYWEEMGDLPTTMEGMDESAAGLSDYDRHNAIPSLAKAMSYDGKTLDDTDYMVAHLAKLGGDDEYAHSKLDNPEFMKALAAELGDSEAGWDDLGSEMDKEFDEGEQHGNSKVYDKCWKGYKKVPGKRRGEKGSCVKEDESMNEMEQLRKLAGLPELDENKVEEASDCDHTCPKSCPDCGGTGKPKKDKVDESYPMGMDPDNNTNVSFNQTKKIGDATLNIHAQAKDMAELQKVLQMAGLDPEGAEQHMPEPDSVKVVSVDPTPSPCGDDVKYSTDKQALVDMLRNKLQSRLG